MSQLIQRMLRAARLEAAFYEEVEADRSALGQAVLVVVLASVAAGIGVPGARTLGGMMAGVFSALLGWFLWSWLTWLIGTKLLPAPETEADYGQLLRTIGFASTPGLLRVFAGLPLVGSLILAVAQVWMLAAMVVAVRQALDYRGTGRAILVCLFGWLVQFVIQIVLRLALAGGAGYTAA